jgi:hypothetical protein
MMKRITCGLVATVLATVSCVPIVPAVADLPIETKLAVTNFSTRFYAAMAVRAHDPQNAGAPFVTLPLLAPGATYRTRFLDVVGEGCPDSVDLRIFLYRRINDELPIGLDPGETVESTPVVADEIFDVPACNVQPLESYTVVNWDAPEGMARVKIAQNTPVDDVIRDLGLFPNVDAAWVVSGVADHLMSTTPPGLLASEPLDGRVTMPDGTGVAGVGVLIRSRFRVRLGDGDPTNDPDAGFGEPIAFTEADAQGLFAFERPPGGYQVEFFSDEFAFRPAIVEVESPQQSIVVIAERL